jgi:Dyp-type peroxidase family
MKNFKGTPIYSPLAKTQGDTPSASPDEPVLDMAEIQGNSLVGFNKDYQSFLFFKITEVDVAKAWVKLIASHVANLEETMAFRRLFRAMRSRRGVEASGLVATWTNIAFTFEGLRKLTSEKALEDFGGEAFRIGMAKRAGLLGDEIDVHGRPVGWVVGTQDNYPDLVLIIASDKKNMLTAKVEQIKAEITNLQGTDPGQPNKQGLQLIFQQDGETLPGSLRGHEHFGFKDGISQPGVRGRVTDSPNDFLTPRIIDPADPLALTHAKPGQPLIWPGQFVLGENYPRQNETGPIQPGPKNVATPKWTTNGSFVVIRRLKQDVAAFWQFVNEEAERLSQTTSFTGMTRERLAALMVGRWQSGAPIMRAPNSDNRDLAANDAAVNHFNFSQITPPVLLRPPAKIPDTFPQAEGDISGSRCPFAAHIRKVNPRDDDTERGGPTHTLPKHILRRGIPFGPPHPDPLGGDDGLDRGLMFVCYQSSIEEQFEFLTQDWANSMVNPHSFQQASGSDRPAGVDPIIGQSTSREFTIRGSNDVFDTIPLTREWIKSTGGGYH